MEQFFHNLIEFTATPSAWTVFLLFLWCLIGEVGVSIPYVLESFWIVVGYNIATANLAPWYVLVLWLAAQAGRQAGSLGLYRIARFGIPALDKFFHKIHLDRFFHKIQARTGTVNRINLASPFSVAAGRMVGLRIPMMLVMAAKKKLGMLSLGVLLSSIVWDALYIAIGAIFGSTVKVEPQYMLLISLGVLTCIYLLTFAIKSIIQHVKKNQPTVSSVDILPADETASSSLTAADPGIEVDQTVAAAPTKPVHGQKVRLSAR
jgi:membrane-associated protein